jgi:Mn2+/Fe2+ NRAMP family transporter
MTDVVAFFIIVACASTIFENGGGPISNAADAAKSLTPLAGHAAGILFAFGLVNASLFAASILPLSTAYYVCEGLGLESGVDKRFQDAPAFYWLYTGLIVVGAGIVVILSEARQVPLILISQVANGMLLPFILIFMLRLSNRADLMGEHRNTRFFNIIAWTTAIVMMVLTALFLVSTFFPGRFPF